MQGTAGNLSNEREFELSRIIKNSDMFGHFHSDNGMARFGRALQFGILAHKWESVRMEWRKCVYKSFIIMSFTTNIIRVLS